MINSKTKLLEIFNIGLRVSKINLACKNFMLNFALGIILAKNVHASDVVSHFDPEVELDSYRSRWSIEVFFQSIKKRGFNLENTHLTELPRLKKLFAIVSMAFAACLSVGLWKHETKKPLKKKANGYKPYSYFRYGLDEMRKALLHPHKMKKLTQQIFDFLLIQLQENYQMWQNWKFILRL